MSSAALSLRFGSARLATSVRWPRALARSVAFVSGEEVSAADPLLEDALVVVLRERHSAAAELAALSWLAEHAGELAAVPDRLLVAGGAWAARLAVAVRDAGWPPLEQQLLISPRFSDESQTPTDLEGVAPATVVSTAGVPDDGARYAALLRAAGVPVRELRR